MQISKMRLEDLNIIKDILECEFDDFWNYSIFKSELENENSIYFKLSLNSEIVGFVGILIVLDTAEITNIVIKKSFRRRGFSKELIKHVINFCREINISKINLEVNATNISAINLYESFNFIPLGKRPKYYKNEDAILYTKFLN